MTLARYLRDRPDLGLHKAIAARLLEPRNPFESASFGRPQRWFALLLLAAFASAAAFVYFNLWN